MPILIGTTIGARWHIVSRIGEGWLFEVYKARDRVTGQLFALKILRPPYWALTDLRKALIEAAERAVNLHHPHIAQVHWVALTDDRQVPFLVCDLVSGTRLYEMVSRRLPLAPPQALDLMSQVADGVAYLHRNGLVHGDLRPQNCLVSSRGDVKVQDYGLWSAFLKSRVTEAEWLERAAPYLSPERFVADHVTPQSDVYSMGAMLYQMLTGRAPFESGRVADLAHLHQAAPVPLASSLHPHVPPAVDSVILKAMSKDPSKRYGTADELRIAVQEASAELAESRAAIRSVPPLPYEQSVGEVGSGEATVERSFWDRLGSVGGLILGGIASAVAVLFLFYLILIRSTPKEVVVPDLTGLTLTEAQRLAGEKGLSVTVVGTKRDPQVEPERILEVVEPAPGARVRQGRSIAVVVSAPPEPIMVPDVMGLLVSSATDRLIAKQLRVGQRVEGYSRQIAKGLVVGQQPPAGSQVDPGTPVNLIVSKGPFPEPSEPQWDRLSGNTVVGRVRITVGGTEVRKTIRVVATDSKGTWEVYKAVHPPGDQIVLVVDGTDFLTVEVFSDGERVLFEEIRSEM